jgi:hypothetical protein
MIVRCIKLLNRDGTPKDGKTDSWLTIGNAYYVLEICRSNDCIKYRLVGDFSPTPALHEAEKFEIVSNQIPDGWVFQLYGRADWTIGPKAWSATGFWESFFDQDETAEAIFHEELQHIADEIKKYQLFGKEVIEFSENNLKEIGVKNWEVEYEDEKTGEKWLMDYPQGALQGGGPPRLRKIS